MIQSHDLSHELANSHFLGEKENTSHIVDDSNHC